MLIGPGYIQNLSARYTIDCSLLVNFGGIFRSVDRVFALKWMHWPGFYLINRLFYYFWLYEGFP